MTKQHMEAVRGTKGMWHLTLGKWDESGNKLLTLCRRAISPNEREFGEAPVYNCGRCFIASLLIKREE